MKEREVTDQMLAIADSIWGDPQKVMALVDLIFIGAEEHPQLPS